MSDTRYIKTVQDEITLYVHESDGVETEFDFGFTVPYDDERNIIVRIRSALTLEYVRINLGTDYSVNFTPGVKGGSITLVNPIQAPDRVEIYRSTPAAQEIADTDLYQPGIREAGDNKANNLAMENRDRSEYLDKMQSGHYGEEDPGGGLPQYPPFVLFDGAVIKDRVAVSVDSTHIASSGNIVDDINGVTILKDNITFTGTRSIKKSVDTTAGTHIEVRESIDNSTLDGNQVMAVIPDPSDPTNKVLLTPTTVDLSGVLTLTNPEVNNLTKVVSSTEITSSAFFRETAGGAEIVDNVIRFTGLGGTTYKGLGLDIDVGTYDEILFRIDEVVNVGDELLGISVEGGSVYIVPVDRGGIIPPPLTDEQYLVSRLGEWTPEPLVVKAPPTEDAGKYLAAKDDGSTEWSTINSLSMTTATLNHYTIVAGDSVITSGIMYEGQLDGRDIVYTETFVGGSFIIYDTPDQYLELIKAGSLDPYKVMFDIPPERVDHQQFAQLLVEGTTVRLIAADPVELPDTMLYHVNVGGGLANNVVVSVGWQDVDLEKFVDDSELTQGAAIWDGVDFDDITLQRIAFFAEEADIVGGAITLDTTVSQYFYTEFNANIDSLTINAGIGDTILWVLGVSGGAGYTIDWVGMTATYGAYFPQGLEYQSVAVSGEVDVLRLEVHPTFILVTQIADSVVVAFGQVVIINGSILGNIITASGTGTVVSATGTSLIDGTDVRSFRMARNTYSGISYRPTAGTIIAGVIDIDIVTNSAYYVVNVLQNVTSIDVSPTYDKAKSASFMLFLEESAAGFTYNFGSSFIYDGGVLPEDSVLGGFKLFVCTWLPSVQLWYAYRQQ